MQALSRETLYQINEKLNDELLKRGYPKITNLSQIDERGLPIAEETDKVFITALSKKFQTTPVLYKALRVRCEGEISEIQKDDDGREFQYVNIRAFAKVALFNGGTNGIGIFEFHCRTYGGYNIILEVSII